MSVLSSGVRNGQQRPVVPVPLLTMSAMSSLTSCGMNYNRSTELLDAQVCAEGIHRESHNWVAEQARRGVGIRGVGCRHATGARTGAAPPLMPRAYRLSVLGIAPSARARVQCRDRDRCQCPSARGRSSGAALAFGSDSTAQIDAGSAVNLAATVGQNSSAASFGFLSAAISTGSDASCAGSPSETPQVANLSISWE